MFRIAVLISDQGQGTNLQAIIDGINQGKIRAVIAGVISDTPKAYGLEWARKHKLPVKIVTKKENLLSVLQKLNPDYVCLAGWKQIIFDEVIDAFPERILNTHPGLIPDILNKTVKNPDGTDGLWNKRKLAGKAMQNFLDNKATYAGCTNHLLTHEFDFGPVLGRCFEKIKTKDTAEFLYARLKKKENSLYVKVLAKLCLKKTVMVVDGGGRGAALVDKYAQSDKVGKVLAVPGNDLMQINTKKPVNTFPYLKTTSIKEILNICKEEKIDLVDVAQDNAVEVGLADALMKKKFMVFGSTRKAGQIEWDKAWARKFMKKYDIPAPEFYVFNLQKDGIDFVKKHPNRKWFVKAAGLAEGKGAISASDIDEAVAAIKQMQNFGAAGKTYLLEEWLTGEEFSAFAFCDGNSFQIAGYAQDHKRVNDGDRGENTGGMGCVSNPAVISNIKDQISKIFDKTIKGLGKEKRPYKGVLYLGGIVVEDKVFVIEFNARWGDPEAEVILPGIKNDLYEVVLAISSGNIKKLKLETDQAVRVAVAVCSKGYPVDYQKVKGKKVSGIERLIKLPDIKIYGAGIKKTSGDYVASGGRVLFIVGKGKDIIQAREKAYQAVKLINIEGNNLHYRKDIGWRDLERLNK